MTRRTWFHQAASAVGAAIIAGITIFPLYWMLVISLLPESAVLNPRPYWIPPRDLFTVQAYVGVLIGSRFFMYMFNSVLIVTLGTTVSLILATSMSFSLAKYRVRGRTGVFYFIIWSLSLPWVVYILPIFEVVSPLGLLDTHLLMIMLYGFSGVPMFSWFALPYMIDFPDDMLDAGRIDGASGPRILAQIVTPAMKNVLTALFLLRFIWAYNDLLFSLSFTFDRAKMMLPALLELPELYGIPYARMMAGALVSIVPIIALVLAFQRNIVSGLTGRTIK